MSNSLVVNINWKWYCIQYHIQISSDMILIYCYRNVKARTRMVSSWLEYVVGMIFWQQWIVWVLGISPKLCKINMLPQEFWSVDMLLTPKFQKQAMATREGTLIQQVAYIPLKYFLLSSLRILAITSVSSNKMSQRNKVSFHYYYLCRSVGVQCWHRMQQYYI